MKIISIEGLPLVGKTTTGKLFCNLLNNKGEKSLYRHGQITENMEAKKCIQKAFKCLEKWDLTLLNNHHIHDFIKYRFEQINYDFRNLMETKENYTEYKYIFIDRYLSGNEIMAGFFNFSDFSLESNIINDNLSMELLLICDFQERRERSLKRDKTNKFTQYSLKDIETHTALNKEHLDYFLQKKNNHKILSSDRYVTLEQVEKTINY